MIKNEMMMRNPEKPTASCLKVFKIWIRLLLHSSSLMFKFPHLIPTSFPTSSYSLLRECSQKVRQIEQIKICIDSHEGRELGRKRYMVSC